MEEEFRRPIVAAADVLVYAVYAHMSESHRGLVGTGTVDWEQVWRGLADAGFEGTLALESFAAIDPDLAAATCPWRPPAQGSETIAREGLAFLREGARARYGGSGRPMEPALDSKAMRSVRRFLALPGEDQRLLLLTACWLLVFQLGLRLVPLRRLRAWSERPRGTRPPGSAEPEIARDIAGHITRVQWALRQAEAHLPLATTCLPQALTAQLLLGRRGAKTELRIGFARNGGSALEGHAWLERDGAVIVGDNGRLEGYTVLPAGS